MSECLRRHKTLLIEDNPADVVLLRSYLEEGRRVDLDLTVATSLDHCRQVLRHDDFEIILLDLTLPESQGLDTLRQVREVSGEAAILVLTGRDDDALAMEAIREGAQDYLVKDVVSADSVTRCICYAVERRGAVARQQELEREVADSQRLSSLGRVVSGIAHEIRNPLQVMRYAHELLTLDEDLRHLEGPQRQLTRIRDAVARASRIVDGLLDYGRPMALELGDYRVALLVDAALEAVNVRESHPGVLVKVHLDADDRVRVDHDRIHQVLINVFQNACVQMPDGGALVIRTSPDEDSPDRIRIEILDSGPGLPPGDVDVFEPFFTTRPAGKGVGLGLSVSRCIVEQHGGDLTIANQERKGAVVSLSLPLASRPVPVHPLLSGEVPPGEEVQPDE